MKINKGMLWYGWEWEKAINEHIKTNDCYFLEVYEDKSDNLFKTNYIFKCYKLMGYGNRFKEYKTIIPKKYYYIIEELKKGNENKFLIVDRFGKKIKEVLRE
jgi:hypothetical protein